MKLYHYTRACPTSIRDNGIQQLGVRGSRERFLSAYSECIPDSIKEELRYRWDKYQPIDPDDEMRDNVFFTVSPIPKGDSGIENLIGMCGGEAVNMVAELDNELGAFLSTLGMPLEVVVSIDENDPHLDILGAEANLSRHVLPSEIVEINKR